MENRNKKIKVLHVLGSMNMGGIQIFLMNIYRSMDREKIEFDFACMNKKNLFKEEIESLGGHVYWIGSHKKVFAHRKRLVEILNSNDYDYVHIHSGNALCTIDAVWSKLNNKNQKVIYHSHNASSKDRVFHYMYRTIIPKYADYMFACSKEAAEWMFPKPVIKKGDYTVITNGIDVRKYLYSAEVAEEVRTELGLKDSFVVGHVGRMAKQKNHKFLIEIFDCIKKMNTNAKLLLVGDGPLAQEIHNQVNELGLEESVLFLGIRNDIGRILCACDAFCLPSLFEGLGIVNLEAQASGLPCYITDTISDEVVLTSLVEKESLRTSPEIWAEKICSARNADRICYNQEVENSKYSLTYTIGQVCDFYKKNL